MDACTRSKLVSGEQTNYMTATSFSACCTRTSIDWQFCLCTVLCYVLCLSCWAAFCQLTLNEYCIILYCRRRLALLTGLLSLVSVEYWHLYTQLTTSVSWSASLLATASAMTSVAWSTEPGASEATATSSASRENAWWVYSIATSRYSETRYRKKLLHKKHTLTQSNRKCHWR